MTAKSDINEKRAVRVTQPLVLLSVFLAVMFLLSFTNSALAAGGMQSDRGTVTGEVVAIDHMDHPTTLTLISSQVGQFPNNQLNIFLNQDTKFRGCKANLPLRDIHVSRDATVTYREVGGVAVAEQISEQC